MNKIGFIGLGNMGSAILQGLLQQNYKKENFGFISSTSSSIQIYQEKYNIKGFNDINELIKYSDILIFAVKPYQLDNVLSKITENMNNKLLISVIAGNDYNTFESKLTSITKQQNLKHISTIPNTAVSISKGIFVCENTHSFNDNDIKIFNNIFSKIALIEYVDSNLLSISGTMIGCSPAFVYLFIEALSDACVKYGIKREISYKLISKMIEGAAALQNETNIHPAILKDNICSPKGTTIKGIVTLEQNNFRGSIIKAIEAIEN